MVNHSSVRVGVVGASGYAGLELLRILVGHPEVQVTYIAAQEARTMDVGTLYPQLLGHLKGQVEAFDAEVCASRCDFVFVALPAGVSGRIAAQLQDLGCKVVDLSGDLRLPAELYTTWYGRTALPDDVLDKAVYGLVEWQRDAVASATLVANPGCYATAALMGLLPAVRASMLMEGAPVVIDAKSGVSGAGRPPKQHTTLAELSENFYAYRIGKHQHVPEIEYYAAPDLSVRVLLTTQLLPVARGIYTSLYIPLQPDVSAADALGVYMDAYGDEPFVHVLPGDAAPELKSVRGANHVQIGVVRDERTNVLQVFSVIDNLQKGAAGQAVQNMNVMLGLPETLGLTAVALMA